MATKYPSEILRAARVLVGLKQSQLAEAANVSRHTLLRVEDGENVTLESIESIVDALEKLGVEFIPATSDRGHGLRWKDPKGGGDVKGKSLEKKR